MKRAAILMGAAVLLVACGNDPVSSSQSTNPEVRVDLLFEHEGCRVHRFYDHGYAHYFARCPETATVETNRAQNCGKGCTKRQRETITTSNIPTTTKEQE